MLEGKRERIIDTGKNLKDDRYVCPNCGATEIKFNQKYGKLYCNFCDSTFEGKKLDEIEHNLFNLNETIIGSGAKNINKNMKDIITLKCGGCGAEVVIDTKNQTHARCHWCRGILSINTRIENGTVPDALLPFKIKKEDAIKEIEKFVKKRKFYALPIFKKEFKPENVMGVYFPYMIVDVKAHCNFEGEGEHLTRRYTVDKKTRYDAEAYKIEREFDIIIDNLTIETNKERLNKLNENQTNNIINSIMPFDIENAIKFESNYLTGFTSEKRNTDIPDLENRVSKQINDITRHSLNDELKYYDRGVRWEKENIQIIGTQWITAYLPVWLYSYHEKNNKKSKIHYVAVNARTKETMGSVPINKPLLSIITLIIIIISIIFLLNIIDYTSDFSFYNLLFLLPGPVYYKVMEAKYRNKKARHKYEKETLNTMVNIKKNERLIEKRRGLRYNKIMGVNNTRIDGDNISSSTNIVERTSDMIIKKM